MKITRTGLLVFFLILSIAFLIYLYRQPWIEPYSIITGSIPTQSDPTIVNPSTDPVSASSCIGRYCYKTEASAYNQTLTTAESVGKYGYKHNWDILQKQVSQVSQEKAENKASEPKTDENVELQCKMFPHLFESCQKQSK